MKGVRISAWAWRLALYWLLGVMLASGGAQASPAEAPAAAGRGYVEQARLAAHGRELVLSGWAAPEQGNVFLTNLIVQVGGCEVYRGRLAGASARPDVVAATGRTAWLHSGFQLRVQLPRGLPSGTQALQVKGRLGDGREFDLETPAGTITIPLSPSPSGVALGMLVLALAVPLALLTWRRRARQVGHRGWLALAAVAPFVLLVASGTTGSSMALLLAEPAVTTGSMQPWAGEPRVIRSDEWQVYTPLALAQAAHVPPFPVVNRNLGSDGQNMLVMGMTAVPVAHASALAKPATWGFFFLDTRHALAWAWWLPIWGGLLAVWLWLRRLLGLAGEPAAALAAGAVLAPYSVAFSFWPAYLLMFLSLGFWAADRALMARSLPARMGWGGLLGWSVAGYALVLYPAWQLSLATLAVPLALAWWWHERRRWAWHWHLWPAVAAAVLVGGWLLGSWWLDAREAVSVMQATVYPGQRASEAGGDIDRWFLFKGWLNPLTLHANLGSMVPVDAASYPFLWLASGAGVLWAAWRTRRVSPLPLVLLGFAAFALGFQFLGYPAWLTRLTLWNVVTVYRLDLALGVAQLVLLGWLMAQPRAAAGVPWRGLALAVALLTAAHALWAYGRMPLDVADGLPGGFVLLSALTAATAAYLLVCQHWRAFWAVYLGWVLAAVLPFHPLGQAPRALALDGALAAAGISQAQPDSAGRRGVAVVGERNWAMTLPAVGVPVVNSLLYYPQPSLWRKLDPDGAQRAVYNRYQRLMFELEEQPAERTYRIESPRLDEVRVYLDPRRFDFSLLDARWVIIPAARAQGLAGNASIERVAGVGADIGAALYRVLP